MDPNLTEDNIFIYTIRNLSNLCQSEADVEEVLNLVRFIKKLFTRYQNSGKINERLLLNHFICFFNNFNSGSAAVRLLFFHLPPDQYTLLKTCLDFLNRLPDTITGIHGVTIYTKYLNTEETLLARLRDA